MHRLHTYSRKALIVLGVIAALYITAIAATAFALNHQRTLRLDRLHISRIWLPAAYQPTIGYNVPTAVVLQDLNSGLMFSRFGARLLDSILVLALLLFAIERATRARRRNTRSRATRPASTSGMMRHALAKAAPYGEGTHRGSRGKVLPFARR